MALMANLYGSSLWSSSFRSRLSKSALNIYHADDDDDDNDDGDDLVGHG